MTSIHGSTLPVRSVMPCTSGCPTPGAHASWGECMRAKGARIGWANSANGLDLSREKAWDSELAAYKDARRQGIQPASTRMRDVQVANELSDFTGKPVNMGKGDLGL